MSDQELSDGDLSKSFPISNRVKHSCILAPVLCGLFFEAILNYANDSCQKGIYIRYITDGELFNLWRLAAKTKVPEELICEALFADVCVLLSHSESDLQLILERFSEATKQFGHIISLEKNEVLFQPAPATTKPNISITGTKLKNGSNFTYLGSSISDDRSLGQEISNRIQRQASLLEDFPIVYSTSLPSNCCQNW